MDLRHLRAFVAVAEERHFGRAAARLRIAQPPLSRKIQALEAELGFTLFARTRRRVELTPAGAVLLEGARRVFGALELATHEARRASVGEIGRIAVGYPTSLAATGLTDLLRAFRSRFPAVEIALREMPPGEQIAALKDGRIDIGFVRGPLEDDALVTECLRKELLMIVLPADHPLASRERIPLPLLAKEPFVMFPRYRGPAFFDLLMALCRDAGFSPRVVLEAPQLDMVSLVVAGFGVAIMPESVSELRREGLVFRNIVGSPKTALLTAWRRSNASPVLKEFLDVVRKVGVARRRS